MDRTRRDFLRASVAASAVVVVGCEVDDANPVVGYDTTDLASDPGGSDAVADVAADAGPDLPPDSLEDVPPDVVDVALDTPDTTDAADIEPGCADPFAGGTQLGLLGFIGEGDPPMDQPFGSGLDGREYYDLQALTPDTLITPIADWYIRTRVPDTIDTSGDWAIQIHGLVDQDKTLTMSELAPLVQDMGTYLLECSGNGPFSHFGMLSVARWRGVPIGQVLDMVDILPQATRVLISGFDGHSKPSTNSVKGASWVYSFEQLASWGAFLATHMNDEPLIPDHGYPVRLFVPGWYGCCNCKWLDEIKLVSDSEPATAQMKEYASRTHQTGVPALAKDYIAATRDQAAMPVRVEKWEVDGEITYKVVGVLWGGYEPTGALSVRFGTGDFVPVTVCPVMTDNRVWSLWEHQWTPTETGTYDIRCRIDDPSIPTRRLDMGFYDRYVDVFEV